MKMRFKTGLASILSASVIFLGLSTSAMAISLGFGVTGGGTHIAATGTETMDTGTQSDSGYANAPIGAAYGQLTVGEGWFGEGNGFTVGYEKMFGEASFETKLSNGDRIDLETGSGRNVAAANAENFSQIYIETPGLTPLGIYLKAGLSEMDIITQEELFTGGSYGDVSLDGDTYGFGFKKTAGGLHYRSEFSKTEWDTFTLSNTGDGADKITGDTVENWTFKFSVGYQF